MSETKIEIVPPTRGWLSCDVCQWRWVPTHQEVLPSECPHCSSRRWNQRGKVLRFDRPKRGPRLWHCANCQWDWFTRGGKQPKRCANCTSPHWEHGVPPNRMRLSRRRAGHSAA